MGLYRQGTFTALCLWLRQHPHFLLSLPVPLLEQGKARVLDVLCSPCVSVQIRFLWLSPSATLVRGAAAVWTQALTWSWKLQVLIL